MTDLSKKLDSIERELSEIKVMVESLYHDLEKAVRWGVSEELQLRDKARDEDQASGI